MAPMRRLTGVEHGAHAMDMVDAQLRREGFKELLEPCIKHIGIEQPHQLKPYLALAAKEFELPLAHLLADLPVSEYERSLKPSAIADKYDALPENIKDELMLLLIFYAALERVNVAYSQCLRGFNITEDQLTEARSGAHQILNTALPDAEADRAIVQGFIQGFIQDTYLSLAQRGYVTLGDDELAKIIPDFSSMKSKTAVAAARPQAVISAPAGVQPPVTAIKKLQEDHAKMLKNMQQDDGLPLNRMLEAYQRNNALDDTSSDWKQKLIEQAKASYGTKEATSGKQPTLEQIAGVNYIYNSIASAVLSAYANNRVLLPAAKRSVLSDGQKESYANQCMQCLPEGWYKKEDALKIVNRAEKIAINALSVTTGRSI